MLKDEFELRKTVGESTIKQLIVNQASKLANPESSDDGASETCKPFSDGAILQKDL